MKSIKLGFILLGYIFLFPNLLFSQTISDSTSTSINEDDDYSFMMINASYTNNNLEYVVNATQNDYQSENIPTVFTNISYINKTGLYLDGSYANYFNARTHTYEYDIAAGYQKYFDNGFDIDIYYNKHNFSGDTLLEGLNYDHSLNLSAGIDIDGFYLSGDLSYLLSSKNNLFFDINLARLIQFDQVIFKNDVLMINPSISLSFGTDYWIYEDMTNAERYLLALDLRKNGYSYNSFSYEGFDFFLPVSYGIGSTYFTFSWLYRIPGNKFKYLGWENQSGFMFSLTYFLNFSKN